MAHEVSQRVETYLRDYGWAFRRTTDSQWQTGFQGRERHFPLRITACDSWVSLYAHPFLKLRIDWEAWPEIARFALELNHACPLVKLVINDQGHIGMTLEILASQFDFEQFSDAVGIMGYYADYLYDEFLTYFDQIGFNYAAQLNLLT